MASVAELESSVSDPTDFPADVDGLRKLDASLRCPICGDIFDAPMMLHCGHSFCSLCARDALRNRKDTKECPQCRKSAEEFHLTKNGSLEEAALNWKAARPAILEMIKNLKKANDDLLRLRKRKGKGKEVVKRSASGSPARPSKRRRTSSEDQSTNRRSNRSRSSVSKDEEKGDDSDDDDVFYIPSSDAEEQAIEEAGDTLTVECPLLCGNMVPTKHVDFHIESNCKKMEPLQKAGTSSVTKKSSKATTSSAWKSVFQQKNASSNGKNSNKELSSEDRLARPAYHTIKEKKLRELCQKHGLPTIGSKEDLEVRHQKYVTCFNANLDRLPKDRKSNEELLRDVKRWEDSLAIKKVDVKDPKSYMKQNNEQFKSQIEAMKARATQKNSDDGSRSTSETGDVVSDSEGEMIL